MAFARSLAGAGLVDGARMAIHGTSAGGLTALAALVRSRVFAGAVAWYGVTDLAALATDTHDFESRYLDGLVGPLPACAAAYRDRSPLHHGSDLVGRVLLLQGSDDPIVPARPGQAVRRRARRASGAGAELLVCSRGSRTASARPATIEAALDAELGFYRAVFAPDRSITSLHTGSWEPGSWRSVVAWLRKSSHGRPARRPAVRCGCALFAGVDRGVGM